MNALTLAKTAYAAQHQAPIRTARGSEYEAFARVTHALKAAALKGQAGFPDLARALHRNRQLWTMLAADVAEADNDLPRDLRARLFYLAEFSTQHSRQVLQRKADVSILLEINMAVMRGLRQQQEVSQ